MEVLPCPILLTSRTTARPTVEQDDITRSLELNEINHTTATIDLETGAEKFRGAGLQKLPGGGVVAIISGLTRADGTQAGRHDLPVDNPAAYCEALS